MTDQTRDTEYQDGALYAIYRQYEWHLTQWDGECFCVIGTGMQSGDRWLPKWTERVVFVAEQYDVIPGSERTVTRVPARPRGFYIGYCERCDEPVYTSTIDLHPALGGHVVAWRDRSGDMQRVPTTEANDG